MSVDGKKCSAKSFLFSTNTMGSINKSGYTMNFGTDFVRSKKKKEKRCEISKDIFFSYSVPLPLTEPNCISWSVKFMVLLAISFEISV